MKRNFPLLAAFALTAVPAVLLAQPGVPHPSYLRARSDMQVAVRILMQPDEPNVMRDLRAAAERVREAIRLVDQAAIIDRKDVEDNPPVDTYPNRPGRFRAAMQMLEAAKRDMSQAEANLSAVGWRNAAIGKVNEAEALIRRAADTEWRDEWGVLAAPPPPPPAQHSHYLEALADLRLARALLWRQDYRNVMEDQREAIREIDEAIREAGRAAINDGRDPRYLPPFDATWRPVDRLTHAQDALGSALRNLAYEEDNYAALGWRQAAIRDVQHARALVNKAIADKNVDRWFDWDRR